MSWANVEWYRQWRREVDAALLREEGKLLAAARAAVVEAACEFVADHGPAGETFAALTRAVDALEALEQSDA